MPRVRERKKTLEAGRDRTKKGILAFQVKKGGRGGGICRILKFSFKEAKCFWPAALLRRRTWKHL